jgi:hypothetical protein
VVPVNKFYFVKKRVYSSWVNVSSEWLRSVETKKKISQGSTKLFPVDLSWGFMVYGEYPRDIPEV